jgi:hypothetical protein
MSPWKPYDIHLVPWERFGDTYVALGYMCSEDKWVDDDGVPRHIKLEWLTVDTVIYDTYDLDTDVDHSLKVHQAIVLGPNDGCFGAAPSNSFKFEACADSGVRGWDG